MELEFYHRRVADPMSRPTQGHMGPRAKYNFGASPRDFHRIVLRYVRGSPGIANSCIPGD